MKGFGRWLERVPVLGYVLTLWQNLVALPRMRVELLGKIASLEKQAADFETEMTQQVGSLARSLRESQRARDALQGGQPRRAPDPERLTRRPLESEKTEQADSTSTSTEPAQHPL